jgi:tetratricopeptide (TPR) repeat protein
MTSEFWVLIDRTRPEGWDPVSHADAITSTLGAAGVDETVGFATAFDEAFDALYTWGLWGAAYLSLGGCSDDAFEYLRAWIIGRGEQTWELARDDPERLFIDFLDGADDPEQRWDEMEIHAGEPLLHAAGVAYERLTGEWLPERERPYPSEPAGDAWEEDQLPDLFPGLFEALPADWWESETETTDDALQVMIQVERGVTKFSEGDHVGAGALLEPIVDDPELWDRVADDRRVDVAYTAGIGRLLAGDVEGAADALRLVESRLNEADHVRRALAQVELARGDLASASRWIDHGKEASRIDRVLAAKLAWRREDHEEAISRAIEEMTTNLEPDEHPWDVAGSAYQIGQIFADAGHLDNATLAVGVMTRLLEDAPADLPLITQLQLLEAGISRLQGRPEEAMAKLGQLEGRLSGTDLAECLREQARAARALGDREQAGSLYEAAVETFAAAGERWDAEATRRESESPTE